MENAMELAVGTIIVAFTIVYFYYNQKSTKKVTLKDMSTTISLELIEKEELSHDTRKFRFALPSKEHILGLPVGQHMSLKYREPETDKLVVRSYTPVTSDDEVGYVDLVVKVYYKNVHPKFPDGGKMSQYLNNMEIGQTIDVSGPKGKLAYKGRGSIYIKHRPRDTIPEQRQATDIGMIAGGTGITPMLQIIRQALKDPKDNTRFHLLFANQTEDDILLRDELDEMVKQHENVKVWYTVDRPTEGWKYSTGFVNAEMIKEHLPAPAPTTQIFLCGPPPMLKFAVLPALEKLGYESNQHFAF